MQSNMQVFIKVETFTQNSRTTAVRNANVQVGLTSAAVAGESRCGEEIKEPMMQTASWALFVGDRGVEPLTSGM
jgi:hypothetical protein